MRGFDLIKPVNPKDHRKNERIGEMKDIEGFYEFLQKDCGLKADVAFSVIYFLQETLPLIPDSIERCNDCDDIFDSDKEGQYCDECGHHHCDLHMCECEAKDEEE